MTDLSAVGKVDAVIYAVSHKEFAELNTDHLAALCLNGNGQGVVVDVKSILKRDEIEAAGMVYWSL